MSAWPSSRGLESRGFALYPTPVPAASTTNRVPYGISRPGFVQITIASLLRCIYPWTSDLLPPKPIPWSQLVEEIPSSLLFPLQDPIMSCSAIAAAASSFVLAATYSSSPKSHILVLVPCLPIHPHDPPFAHTLALAKIATCSILN